MATAMLVAVVVVTATVADQPAAAGVGVEAGEGGRRGEEDIEVGLRCVSG